MRCARRIMMSLASVSWEAASESDGTPDQNNGLFWPLTVGQHFPLGRWAIAAEAGAGVNGDGTRAPSRLLFVSSKFMHVPPESGGVGRTGSMTQFERSIVIVRIACVTSRISCGFRGRPEPHTPPVRAGTPHGSARAGAAAVAPSRVRMHRPHRSLNATTGEFGTLQSAVIPGWQVCGERSQRR